MSGGTAEQEDFADAHLKKLESVCLYDLDEVDEQWLESVNQERDEMGKEIAKIEKTILQHMVNFEQGPMVKDFIRFIAIQNCNALWVGRGGNRRRSICCHAR